MSIMLTHWLLIIIAGMNMLLGIRVFLRKPRHAIHQTFFVAVAGMTIWMIGFASLLRTGEFGIYEKISLYGGLLSAVGFFYFGKYFSQVSLHRILDVVWLIPALIPAILLPWNLIMIHVVTTSNYMLEPTNGRFFWVYVLVFCFYIVGALYFVMRALVKSSYQQRQKLWYFIFGSAFLFVSVTVFDVILPAFGIFQFNILGPFITIIFSMVTSYAILRHQLLDMRVFIQRGIIYIFLVAVMGVLYMVGLVSLQKLSFDHSPIIISVVLTLLGVFLIPHFEKFLRRVTSHIFFVDTFSYDRAMQKITAVLHVAETGNELENGFLEILQHVLAVSSAAFSGQNLILGEKHSGFPLSKIEKRFIDVSLLQYRIALQKIQLADRLRNHIESLEDLIQERTKEVYDLHAQQERIMVDVAHNLQTPLALVKNELASLRGTFSDRHINTFEKSIDRLSDFMYRLLRATRLELSLVQKEVFNISEVLNESVEYFSVIAHQNNAVIIADVVSNLFIEGNAQEIEECLSNIVSNAFKYKKKNILTKVKIQLFPKDDTVVLTIQDNGVGIAPENLKHIFERLYRIDGEQQVKGSGLGLTICKNIIERHHGTISVKSVLGKGTTFMIVLPKK